MPTTVHIPDDLLERVDERARALHVSRNRYIVRALENRLQKETEWSAEFAEFLVGPSADEALGEAVDEMLGHIERSSRSKRPPKL